MNKTYHEISIVTLDDGTVSVRENTNDDNDDGYPDGKEVWWDWQAKNLDAALKHTGKSRIGISGIRVTVTIDGEEV